MLPMGWGKKTIGGTDYPLSHLDPFFMECPRATGTPIRLKVEFGSHCFTQKWGAHHTPDLLFMDGKTKRAFCLHRYAHSLHLAAAVRQAVAGHVFNNGGRLNIGATLPGIAGPYLIAFRLLPAKSPNADLRMLVVSAHLKPNMNLKAPKAKFTVVVAATQAGATIRWK